VLRAVHLLALIVMALLQDIDRLISADGQGKFRFSTMLTLKKYSLFYIVLPIEIDVLPSNTYKKVPV
jgi:hypothetical protein